MHTAYGGALYQTGSVVIFVVSILRFHFAVPHWFENPEIGSPCWVVPSYAHDFFLAPKEIFLTCLACKKGCGRYRTGANEFYTTSVATSPSISPSKKRSNFGFRGE